MSPAPARISGVRHQVQSVGWSALVMTTSIPPLPSCCSYVTYAQNGGSRPIATDGWWTPGPGAKREQHTTFPPAGAIDPIPPAPNSNTTPISLFPSELTAIDGFIKSMVDIETPPARLQVAPPSRDSMIRRP